VKVDGVGFSGAQIAIVLAFISTIAGGIWTASSVYGRLEAVEAYEIPDTSVLHEDIQLIKQELDDNDISQLQAKLATIGVNLETIMTQQTKLLLLQEKMTAVEKEMEAMKGIVQRAEVSVKDVEKFEGKVSKMQREIQELWDGMDYLSNPLK
jgi:DNA repair exonuclease SbcCD ATPase subunit